MLVSYVRNITLATCNTISCNAIFAIRVRCLSCIFTILYCSIPFQSSPYSISVISDIPTELLSIGNRMKINPKAFAIPILTAIPNIIKRMESK